jgi:hypothetical protein
MLREVLSKTPAAFEFVGRRVEVLVQSMLAAKGPVAIIALVY